MYLTQLFCGDLCYYLIRKSCYRSENHVPKFKAASRGLIARHAVIDRSRRCDHSEPR